MGFLLPVLIGLLGIGSGLVGADVEDCPKLCSCSVKGVTQLTAACSGFDATYKFDPSTAKLSIENAGGLVLGNNVFHNANLGAMRDLTIMSNVFQRVDARAFSGLKKLENLRLEANNRLRLYADMFNSTIVRHLAIRQNKMVFADHHRYLFDMPHLVELELVDCDVALFLNNDTFSKMPLLEYVKLASNMIRNVEPMFSKLEFLEQVDLSDNHISELESDLFPLNLDILVLRKNPLTTVKGLSCPRLTELDLSLCKFNRIDEEDFSGLPWLNRLNLSGNAISEIDERAFSNLSDLIQVDLSNNALKGPLSEDLFKRNAGLQVISLAHNPSLRELPPNLFSGLEDLYSIDLSFCGLTILDQDQFSRIRSLSTLNLAGNALQEIAPHTLVSSILRLDLSHNAFTDLDLIDFSGGLRVETLSLANNKLQQVASRHFKDLRYLTSLDLHSCGLRDLWVNDRNEKPPVLEGVTELLVSKNSIQQVSAHQLQLTPRLRYLDISDNRLVCNASLRAGLKWLSSHKVDVRETLQKRSEKVLPGHPYGEDGLAHPNPLDIANTEEVTNNPRSWKQIENALCGQANREALEPNMEYPELGDDLDDEDDEDEDEDDGEDDYVQEKVGRVAEVEIKQVSVEERIDDLDLWPIAVVAISGLAILLSLSVLSCFALRWYRQRNSYGAAMIKHHLNTPRLRRDRSSIYQQLHEELNSPTTPVMSIKIGKTEYSKVAPQSV